MSKNIPPLSDIKYCLCKDLICLEADGFFPFWNLETKHLFLYIYYSLNSRKKCWYLSFRSLCYLHSFQSVNTINSFSDNSIPRTWLVNHTLHFSITVHHVGGNNFVASDCSQMLFRTIFFYISNIHFLCHIISKYSVGNIPLSINFDWTVMIDPNSPSLYCIN